MGDLVYIPDHKAIARAALLQQHQSKPRIVALVNALGEGAQTHEDEGFDVLISTTLQTAQGVNLNEWGALVGEVRGDLDDADYRVFITARIRVNKSKGDTDSILAIWAIVVAPYIEIRHKNYKPATFQLYALRGSLMSTSRAQRVGALMRDVKPGGVGMSLIEARPGYFGFLNNPDALPFGIGHFARAL